MAVLALKMPLINTQDYLTLNMYGTMENYDYILTQSRKTDVNAWNDEMVGEAIKHLGCLSDQDLCDLLFEKEIQVLGTIAPLYPEENSEAIKINEMQNKLKSAIINAVPTNKLVEIMHSSPKDYIGKNGKKRSMDFLNTFRQTIDLVRDELIGRYISDIDEEIEGNLFSKIQENLRWEKWKQEATSLRYQDPYLKRFEKDEILFTDEDLERRLIWYDDVISIKSSHHFWDDNGKRLCAIHYILSDLCKVVPQYIGLGDEVVFAVAPDDYNLHADFDNTPLHDKLYEIIDEEYQRNLVLGCMLIEKFIHLIDPKTSVEVRCYDRDYLVGRFVIEGWYPEKIFGEHSFLSVIEKMAIDEKKTITSFLELAKNLLKPPAKVPF